MSKKRTLSEGSTSSPNKRTTRASTHEGASPAEIEASLALPSSDASASDLEVSNIVLLTNRAPLVLAFAVVLLKYTRPEQPLSSRLSLAQAVVSANSRSKAVSIGLENGRTAEDEGWGQGQPGIKVMSREIRVMKRWGYDPEMDIKKEVEHDPEMDVKREVEDEAKREDGDGAAESQNTISHQEDKPPALWGLDLEALRKSNGPRVAGAHNSGSGGLPIYSADSARAYLLKAFNLPPPADLATKASSPPKKKSATILAMEKADAVGFLLKTLDLLFSSWAPTLGRDELDRRAWSWYLHVRPDVESGVAGWGQKGQVKLSDILALRRKP